MKTTKQKLKEALTPLVNSILREFEGINEAEPPTQQPNVQGPAKPQKIGNAMVRIEPETKQVSILVGGKTVVLDKMTASKV